MVQFSSMADKHGLSPKLEHCVCMVDLLGQAGHVKEAYELVQNTIIPSDSIIWVETIIALQDPNLGYAFCCGTFMKSEKISTLPLIASPTAISM
ncbi:hypothetical protein AAG906_016037 [Vitis piasezkii]